MQNSFDYSNSFAGIADTNLQISMYLSNANSSTLNLIDRKRVLWFYGPRHERQTFCICHQHPLPPFQQTNQMEKKQTFICI